MEQARAIEYMGQTDGWKIMQGWLKKRVEYHMKQLETCKTWEEVQEHRSKLSVYKSILGKPSDIINQINNTE